MLDTNIGERIASLEAEFRGFRSEMLKDNEYIKRRLDTIVDGLSSKVDRSYCYERHNKLDDVIGELRIKTPAIIQTIVVALTTGLVMALATYVIGHLP